MIRDMHVRPGFLLAAGAGLPPPPPPLTAAVTCAYVLKRSFNGSLKHLRVCAPVPFLLEN
eukprot:1077716-Amphidinium_carterae.1